MNLHSDYPYWLMRSGVLGAFPTLSRDIVTDVLVIGGGISGALIAHELARRNVGVTVVDKRHIGFGSTSASTALLQYEIDSPLHELSARIGERKAARAFQLCAEAIDVIGGLCATIPGKAEFRRRPSLWFARHRKDVAETIEPEFAARKKHGFRVRLLDEQDVTALYGFSAPAAILSEAGATCQPYLLTHALMSRIVDRGGAVFDLTDVDRWSVGARRVDVVTKRGQRIRAKHVVVAAGYESQAMLPKLVTRFHSTYAVVGKPTPAAKPWHRDSLLWDSGSPYLYLRSTPDGRIIAGGRDETFQSAGKRDALIRRKAGEIARDVRKLFPERSFEVDFAWAGTFGQTRDSLPYIGTFGSRRIHYALGYGGNGITFSVVAAFLIADAITGCANADARIFAFDR